MGKEPQDNVYPLDAKIIDKNLPKDQLWTCRLDKIYHLRDESGRAATTGSNQITLPWLARC